MRNKKTMQKTKLEPLTMEQINFLDKVVGRQDGYSWNTKTRGWYRVEKTGKINVRRGFEVRLDKKSDEFINYRARKGKSLYDFQYGIEWGIIYGDFDCSGLKLTDLKGGPSEVSGSFECWGNSLTSLDGIPKKAKWMSLYDNKISNLLGSEGVKTEVITLYENPITSLKSNSMKTSFKIELGDILGLETKIEKGEASLNDYCINNKLIYSLDYSLDSDGEISL